VAGLPARRYCVDTLISTTPRLIVALELGVPVICRPLECGV
jgi:hypothetical protein